MAEPDSLLAEALQAITDSGDENSLEQLRVQFLGKKESLTALLKSLGQLPAEERPASGEKIILVKRQIPAAMVTRKA